MSQNIRDALQFLLYPLTLAVAGYIFNSHLDETRKTEVMEKFVPRLTGNSPADSFLADRLIDKILDKSTAADVHRITRETWRARLHRAVTEGNAQEARLIAETANVYGGEIGREVLQDVQSVNSALLVGYQQTGKSASAAGKLDLTKSLEASQAPRQVVAAAAIAPEIEQATSQSSAQTISQTEQYSWIYLGPTAAGKWLKRNFEEDLTPEQMKNATATTSTDVFRRSDLPRFADGEWKLGQITGVLSSHQKVLVQDIQSVPGVNNTKLWWAWITPR